MIKTLLVLVALLAAPRAYAFTCGTTAAQTTRSPAGQGPYVWQTSQATLHGTVTLNEISGRIFGTLSQPAEITNPAGWPRQVTGRVNGTSLLLFSPDPDTAWTFELDVSLNTKAGILSIRGVEYAGWYHEVQTGLTFSASYPYANSLTTGSPINCALASPPTIPGTFSYTWQWNSATTYTGVFTTQQRGSFLLATVGVPNEITDPTARAQWGQIAFGEFFSDARGPRLEWLLWPTGPGQTAWAENTYLPPSLLTSFYNPSPNLLGYPWGGGLGFYFTASGGH